MQIQKQDLGLSQSYLAPSSEMLIWLSGGQLAQSHFSPTYQKDYLIYNFYGTTHHSAAGAKRPFLFVKGENKLITANCLPKKGIFLFFS